MRLRWGGLQKSSPRGSARPRIFTRSSWKASSFNNMPTSPHELSRPDLWRGGRDREADDSSRVMKIGSIDGFRTPKLETYACSLFEAASHQLSVRLASLLSKQHITINAIASGMCPPKMMHGTLDRVSEEKVVAKIPPSHLTEADDVAGAAIYLASRVTSCVTGAVVPMDGGAATAL